MSTSSRFLCLFAVLSGSVWAGAVHADSPPSLFGKPMPAENGFTLLQDAIKNYGGSLASGGDMSPADKIRYERTNVTRNVETLRKIRAALALPVQQPQVRDMNAEPMNYDGFKKLARLLKQEAYVRYSNGDWVGAMNSNLDAIQLGVAITRGASLDAFLAGLEIENIGREDLDRFVNKLTIDEQRAAAVRVGKIEELRTAFSDALQEEKARALAQTKQAFEDLDWTDTIEQTTKPNGDHFSDDEKATLTNTGESEVLASLSQVMDQVEKDANSPYKPGMGKAPRGLDPWTKMMTDVVATPIFRVSYEAARTQNKLLQIALQLSAEKTQTGKYPATVELPDDPFSGAAAIKLKYRLDGDSYVLYSVGPNGKDDGGVPLVLNEDGTIPPNAANDLLAPVFNQ